jgi:hypothetical protein
VGRNGSVGTTVASHPRRHIFVEILNRKPLFFYIYIPKSASFSYSLFHGKIVKESIEGQLADNLLQWL